MDDLKALETGVRNRARALAQARALSRLSKKYSEEYQEIYREECAKAGLKNRTTRTERIERLRAELARLEQDFNQGGSE